VNKVETIRITTKTPARIIWPALTQEAVDLNTARSAKAGVEIENAKGGVFAAFDAKDPTIVELMNTAAKMAKDAFGLASVKKADLFAAKGEVHFPFKDGNGPKLLKTKKGDEREYFKDKIVLDAKVYGGQFPSVYHDPTGNGDWEETTADKVFSGCYAYITIDLFPTEKLGNKSVCAGLKAVAFHRGTKEDRIGASAVGPDAFKGVQGASVAFDPRATATDDDEISA